MPRRIPKKFYIKLENTTTVVPTPSINYLAILNAEILLLKREHGGNFSSYLQESSSAFKSSTARSLASNTRSLASNAKSSSFNNKYLKAYTNSIKNERFISTTTTQAITNNIYLIGLIVLLSATLISGFGFIFCYLKRKRKHHPLTQSASLASTGSESTTMGINLRNRNQQLVPDNFETQNNEIKPSHSRTTHIINNINNNKGFSEIDL